MKTSPFLSSLVVGGSLVLAASSFAQADVTTRSTSGTTLNQPQPSTGSTLRNPSTLNPNQQTSPLSDVVPSDTAVAPTVNSSSSTSSGGIGAADSTSSSSVNARTSSADDAASARPAPRLNVFTVLDTDSDGRVSLNEFTASSASLNGQGSLGASVSDGVTSNTASRSTAELNSGGVVSTPGNVSGQTDPVGASASSQRSPGAGFSGATAPGISSGATVMGGNSAQLFQQLDTDHDGFLSRSELSASGRTTTP